MDRSTAQTSRTSIEALRLTKQRLPALTVKCSGSLNQRRTLRNSRGELSATSMREAEKREPSWANSHDREQPRTDWRRQPGTRSKGVLRLIRARSCGEAEARTPIMC